MSAGDFSGLRILVVEDEALVAMLIEDELTELGCEVIGPAARLDKAVEIAADAAIDAAILDVNLGGQETYPVADVLRDRGIPFVFATGYGASGVRRGYDAGPTLQKPFRPNDLARALRQALARRGPPG